jgi:predicted dehydrogenase
MSAIAELRAGVVGTGFIGAVHVDALRRLGVEVLGVVGSTPERARAKGLGHVYESLDAMLEDDRVDVVHLTTPNNLHYPQAKQALAAGKHVVCEKPLAVTSEQSGELVELAERSGLVHCTNFNLRFYPLVLEARERVRAGEVGDVWDVHGGFLQDWLALPTDWNWRLEPERGGELRAVGDIGSHWMDMTRFVTGARIVRLFADLSTVIPVRRRPIGEVETFAAAGDIERRTAAMSSEDLRAICSGTRTVPRLSRRVAGLMGARPRSGSRSTLRRSRSPGTRAHESCGLAIATGRTRRSCATRL